MNIRPEVMRFAEHMEAKLVENDHKKHWRDENYPLQGHLEMVLVEVRELDEQLDLLNHGVGSVEDVIKEAADVANRAMIISDLLDEGRPEKTERGK